MGVDEFILRPCADDLDQMDRLAELAAQLATASISERKAVLQ
jgi:hypothetical protein